METIENRVNLVHGSKWKGLNARTTKFYHDLVEPNQKQYDRLKELHKTYPELTYQNEGYDTPVGLKNTHREQMKEISEILKSSLLGFCEFNHFKKRKNGDTVLRLQYLWDGSFKGVGYIDLKYWDPLVHASMYIYYKDILTEESSLKEKAGWLKGLNLSGYAGILKDGSIVDRREFPEAVAIQKNNKLGIVEPKKIEDEYLTT